MEIIDQNCSHHPTVHHNTCDAQQISNIILLLTNQAEKSARWEDPTYAVFPNYQAVSGIRDIEIADSPPIRIFYIL